ncbi:MAG: polyphosphate polymerase domain-containing protein [Clostridia bacterium]|nr:polyphosphate polymerase domain-containing protein [Clostridia bacterium]MBQ8637377.1 polyphosphate polymerase domain-containing protein [Clostridia bacterium]
MNVVTREEKKFLISLEEFRNKSHFLDSLMIQDEHNGIDGYIIRSLYFDTVYDDDFFEKLEGVETRRKIRLRIYDPKHDFAMLEMKQKQGANQKKRSLRMTKEDAEALIAGHYDVLLKYEEDFAKECYALMLYKCYRPKTIVQYNRKAYIAKENKIRITFDNNIVATETNFDLFSENLVMYPVLDKFNVVLEVKFNGFLLDYIRQFINSINKSELSVSKYALARQQSYAEI